MISLPDMSIKKSVSASNTFSLMSENQKLLFEITASWHLLSAQTLSRLSVCRETNKKVLEPLHILPVNKIDTYEDTT